jgi:Reverse transcriptase (RNA-dependent DNA polymerase)
LVDLPKDRKAVKCKWVYCIKFSANGKPNRFKARLVAKGFTQILGLNYDETFSLVARLDSIRILLALATLEDWEIHQINIKMAFLNGDLDKEIYMQQLEGFIAAGQSGKVCRLRKALYGLKQALRQWHRKLHSALGKIGF